MAKNNLKSFSNVYKVLDTFGKQTVAEMVTRLKSAKKVASGKLLRSLKYQIQENQEDFELYFLMEPYGVFVDKGRKPGTPPPIKALRAWARLKKIPLTALYAIAKAIGKRGIAPTNFFTISLNRNLPRLNKALAKAVEQDAIALAKSEVSSIIKSVKSK